MIISINYRLLPSNSINRAHLYHLQFQDGATGQQGQEASHCAQASDCEEGCERSSRSFQLQNFIRIQLQPPEQFLLWSWSWQGEHEPSCLPSYVKITTFIIIIIVKSIIIICVSSINQQSEKSSNSSCKTASSSSASNC